MAAVSDVQVCVGCDHRFVGEARVDGGIVSCPCGTDQGWLQCLHTEGCDAPMCKKTEKWLAGG